MPHENWRCAGLLAGSSVLAGAPPEDVDEHRPDIAPVFQMGEEDSTMAMQRYTLTTAGGARTVDTWYDTTTDGDTAVITLPDAPAIWLIHRPHAQGVSAGVWAALLQVGGPHSDRWPCPPSSMGVTADQTIAPTHASKAVKASRRGSPSPDGQAHDARSTPRRTCMDDAGAQVIDLIFGRWRSQILYAGVKLGVFDALAHGPKSAVRVASELDVDAGLLYRLMRALGSLGLLHEDHTRTFALTPMGELLCRDHPHTLRGITLLEEGPEHYAAWKHLPALITEGQQNAFVREFGQPHV